MTARIANDRADMLRALVRANTEGDIRSALLMRDQIKPSRYR
ncbi:hypothetical protein NX862_05515 [Rhodobacter sp. KR11]|nr:hypothetical protein [Rhodobacter sp. KR11]MCW1918202.1 hypothetical protein [Rhodobacter sp. KR11]